MIMSVATPSNVEFDDSWMDAEWELLQSDETYEIQVADVQMIYHQMVISNQLLGILVAALVIAMIFAVMKFFIKLVTHNITNYF